MYQSREVRHVAFGQITSNERSTWNTIFFLFGDNIKTVLWEWGVRMYKKSNVNMIMNTSIV